MFNRFILLAGIACVTLIACQPTKQNEYHLSVQADAETYREPDQARLVLRIEQQGDDLPSLKQIVDRNTAKVLKTLHDNQVPERDISSFRINAVPIYDYQDGQRIQRGYSVARTIHITLSDLNRYDIILDYALQSGVSEIVQSDFVVSSPEQHYRAMLEQAVLNARSKAELIAKAAGATVIGVTAVQEMSQAPAPIMYAESARFRQADNVSLPGTQAIRAQVQVTYAITH